MDVKDQIRTRRVALKLTIPQLAKELGVSEQTVRHWETGRNYPVKKRRTDIEKALDLRLDWRGGGAPMDQRGSTLFDREDIELLGKLCRLPASTKAILSRLIDEFPATDRRVAFNDRITGEPVPAFNIRATAASEQRRPARAKKAQR